MPCLALDAGLAGGKIYRVIEDYVMTNRNWNFITSGAMFEALATTLIRFEDPKAALFGRRGKDGGQDARSGDGTRVFQAKHHEDGSAAKAIADAKQEAEQIVEYRKPGHPRYEQWKGVTHWRLVTNAPFNPANLQRWNTEVVPLFARLSERILGGNRRASTTSPQRSGSRLASLGCPHRYCEPGGRPNRQAPREGERSRGRNRCAENAGQLS